MNPTALEILDGTARQLLLLSTKCAFDRPHEFLGAAIDQAICAESMLTAQHQRVEIRVQADWAFESGCVHPQLLNSLSLLCWAHLWIVLNGTFVGDRLEKMIRQRRRN